MTTNKNGKATHKKWPSAREQDRELRRQLGARASEIVNALTTSNDHLSSAFSMDILNMAVGKCMADYANENNKDLWRKERVLDKLIERSAIEISVKAWLAFDSYNQA